MAVRAMPQRVSDDRPQVHRGPGQPGKIEKAKDPRQAVVRLLDYLRPFMPSLILVMGFVVLYTLLGLLGPYLIGVAIDTYIGGGDTAGLGRIALIMLAVYLGNNLAQAAAGWIMAGVSQRGLKQMRRDLFGHIQQLSVGFFDTNPAGGLMSRLTNDVDAINQAVSQNVTSLIARWRLQA